MESPHEVKPQLSEQQRFWEDLRVACLQKFTSVRWSTIHDQWYLGLCKWHICQDVLCKVSSKVQEGDWDDMKRKQGDEQPERYIFVVDAIVKHHQFSKEEIKFLKQINLDGFMARVSWGVLHEALVREAVANLEEATMNTLCGVRSSHCCNPIGERNFKTHLSSRLAKCQPPNNGK